MHKLKLLCINRKYFAETKWKLLAFLWVVFILGGQSSCKTLAVQCQTLASMDALTDPVRKMLLSQPAGVNVSLDLDLSLS